MKIFCIFDKKSGEHFGFSVWPNVEIYKRSLHADVNDSNPRNLLASHPSDFELFCLGDFDVKSGEIQYAREFLCNVSDLKGGAFE